MKIHVCILHSEWIFLLRCDFGGSHIGHLENLGSVSYANLPDVDTFHRTV